MRAGNNNTKTGRHLTGGDPDLANQKLASIFSAAPVGIGMVKSRVIVEVNEKLCLMLGYEKHELIGQNSRILYPSQQEYERVGRVKYAMIEKFGTGSIETKWKCKNGSIIDIQLNSAPLDSHDLSKGVTFTALDITEKNKALFSLRMSDQRFRNIANYTYDWEIWLSNSKTLLWVNPGVQRITGYTVSECMNMKDFPCNIVCHEDVEMVKTALSLSVQGTSVDNLEFRIETKHNDIKWISLCSQPIYDNDNNTQGVRASLRDITVRKKTDLAIHNFLKFTSSKFGKAFFDSLVRQLSQALDAEMLFIGHLLSSTQNTIQTLSVYSKDHHMDNFEYDLENTPCKNIMSSNTCIHKSDPVLEFSKSEAVARNNFQAFAAVPLFDSFSCPLGVITALFKKPLREVRFVENMLQIFASRTAAEIERNNYEKAFIHRLNYEDMISEISTDFANIEINDIDSAINMSLEKTAKFSKADCCYVSIFSKDGKHMSMTNVWHNNFIKINKSQMQNLSLSDFPVKITKLFSKVPAIVTSVEEMPKTAEKEKAFFDSLHIKSAVDIVMVHENRAVGYIGLCSTLMHRYWTEDDMSLLKIVGQIISSSLARKGTFL